MCDKDSDLRKVLRDLVTDLCGTFPESASSWPAEVLRMKDPDSHEEALDALREHCCSTLPSHFFDILYENEEIFKAKEPVFVLPGVDFAELWNSEGVTDATRATLWKYMQLLVFGIVGHMEDAQSFGDAAHLFKAIDADELRSKLEEMVKNMESMGGDGESLPDPEGLKEHIDKILGGKLGMLAKEIAEETAEELGLSGEGDDAPTDTFKRLFKDPTRLISLVKSIGGKLDAKIKSGEIKEAELLSEATELLKNMGSMPGMENLKQMFGKQAGVDFSKIDPKVMEARMKTGMRGAAQRDRLRAKLARRKEANVPSAQPATQSAAQSQAAVMESLKEVKRRRGKKKNRRPK